MSDRDEILRRIQRHLAAAQHLARMGSFDFDLRTKEATWSPMMFELHAADPSQPAPSTFEAYATMLHPDDATGLAATWARAVDTGQVCETEIRAGRQDGWRRLRVRVHCERGPDGTPTLMSGTMQDMREEVERRAELVREREHAEGEARAKTRFLARVTHELRAPLAGVIGMIDLALGDVSADARADHLASARASARHLLELIDDLLDASREDTWRINVVDIEFDLGEVLAQALAMVVPRARRKQLAVSGHVDRRVTCKRIGDPLRLRQILVNLLYNAVKFTHQGRVEARILGGDDGDEDDVAIVVEDTGIGIAPEQQVAVFEPFVQAQDRPREGIGLGLAITRELVSALGGSIELESTPGVGTRFTVRLRLRRGGELGRPGDRLRAIEQPSSPGVPVRSLRVLIAEDNPTNAAIAQAILERAGHRPTWVADGAAAVEAVAAERFDVILMDLEMPRLDGAAATRAIRAAEHAAGLARVPVIALSAHRDAALTAASAGMDAYMAKPVNAEGLVELLARAVRGDLAGPIDHTARVARVGGRTDLGRMIVQTFLAHRPTLLDQLDAALARRSLPDMRRAAHGLRGALGMVGAHRAVEIAHDIEAATLTDAARLRDRLANEIACACADLELVAGT